MSNPFRQLAFVLVATILFVGKTAVAQGVGSDNLTQKQEEQQRARVLTRELLTGILDVQLRQLAENGLTEHEIYRDTHLMRQNLNRLVEIEMPKVVELLASASRLPPEKREANLVEARQQIRSVVRQLSIERQSLLKRLKVVELADQVRRLIQQQAAVQAITKNIPVENEPRREALILKTIEDQRDVKEMYLHLVDTLNDLRSWNGLVSTVALDGFRILKVADVNHHLDLCGQYLKAVKAELAGDEQRHVSKGLNELLKLIERAQGSLDSDRLTAIEKVRALLDRQKQLRDETKQLPENQPPSSEFVERQSRLKHEIAQLQLFVQDNLKGQTYLQQAETSALDAAANLMENKPDPAIAEQGRVLGNLAALELELNNQNQLPSQNKSADELAEAVKQLTAIKAALTDVCSKHETIEKKADHDRQSANTEAIGVAKIIQQTITSFDPPEPAKTNLLAAVDAAIIEAKALESTRSETTQKENHEQTRMSLIRAMATMDAALADAQRHAFAVKIGELARAAEVLERLASESRTIAKTFNEDSAERDTVETAQKFADRQSEVITIADKLVQAIARTANSASNQAAIAVTNAKQSQRHFLTVAERKSLDPIAALIEANQTARPSSQQFAEAAKLIRDEIVSTAKQLIQRTTLQASDLAEVRTALENSLDQFPSHARTTQLEAAKDKLGEAIQLQAIAEGKPDAATAMQLEKRIAAALAAQETANTIVAMIQSDNDWELKSIAKQAEVAEIVQAAATAASHLNQVKTDADRKSENLLTQVLSDAQREATAAARQLLDGDRSGAEKTRQRVETKLKVAAELVQQDVVSALNAPASRSIDRLAQTQAATLTDSSRSIARQVSLDAAAEVEPAATATHEADKAISANRDDSRSAQEKAIRTLQVADQKLAIAIQKSIQDQKNALTQHANDNRGLAGRVASVAPTAADAVHHAAREAITGSVSGNTSQQLSTIANRAELALERAAADLGAKEQEVRRNQAIAESVATLAREQQDATETIAQQAVLLEQPLAIADDGDGNTANQRSTAKKLYDAQQQFAESLRATGQGAVELSGQREVANIPLREALELAANLSGGDISPPDLAEAEAPDSQTAATENDAMTDGRPNDLNQPQTTEKAATQAKGQRDDARTDQSGQAARGSGKSNGLGTGFVPQSPQMTAEMMAGIEAQKAAQKALEQQLPMGQESGNDPSATSDPTREFEDGQSITSENAHSSKLTKKEGAAAVNQKVKGGVVDKQREGTESPGIASSKTREKEEGILSRRLKEEAWFAKLPAELRKSIRAGTAQKPPRAYEERLNRYFQSVD